MQGKLLEKILKINRHFIQKLLICFENSTVYLLKYWYCYEFDTNRYTIESMWQYLVVPLTNVRKTCVMKYGLWTTSKSPLQHLVKPDPHYCISTVYTTKENNHVKNHPSRPLVCEKPETVISE